MSATVPREFLDPGLEIPPPPDELPCDDGVPMETERHRLQMQLLIESLDPWLQQRDDGYVGGNMFVYFSMAQVRGQDFKGPDVFVVLDVPKGERKRWVVWEEGKGPDVVIELLSESTMTNDKTTKKKVYASKLKVNEYFWFDPFDPDDWAGFELRCGEYVELKRAPENTFFSKVMNLSLRHWTGHYKNVETTWLRWATTEGTLLPTMDELHQIEQQRAEAETQRAEAATQRAEAESERAENEAMARRKAEQRTAEVEAELARLRAKLEG